MELIKLKNAQIKTVEVTSAYLTPKQVAEILNCKLSTIYAWAKNGEIPAYKIKGILRFNKDEVHEWIKGFKIRPEPIQSKIDTKHISKNAINNIIENAIVSVKTEGYNVNQREIRPVRPKKEVINGAL